MKRRGIVAIALVLAAGAAPASARPHRHAAHDRSRGTQHGLASFYNRHEAGRRTASGTPLRLDRMTAASPTLPLGARAKVTNPASGKSVVVTINDRSAGSKGRVLDVTPKVAERLGIRPEKGVAAVDVTPVSRSAAPPR